MFKNTSNKIIAINFREVEQRDHKHKKIDRVLFLRKII
jgi:hypothetical protein